MAVEIKVCEDGKEWDTLQRHIKKIIETCKQKGAWIATGEEINRWWRSR